MKLAQIIKLAMRQLDENIEDVAEYEELFVSYANMGNQIAVHEYYRPRETMAGETDEHGALNISGMGIRRVISVRSPQSREWMFSVSQTGDEIYIGVPHVEIEIIYEPEARQLALGDEPIFPVSAHPALADYICFRHLSSGNLAKQSRAEFFRQAFYQQMRGIQPQSAGSVSRMKNLYAVTDIRYRR